MKHLIEQATDLVSGQHRQIAESIGVTPHALACWRSGKRRPTPENLARLGEALIQRSRELQLAGYELVRAAEQMQQRSVADVPDESREELNLFA